MGNLGVGVQGLGFGVLGIAIQIGQQGIAIAILGIAIAIRQ